MQTLLKSAQRGHTRIGWLDSHHTFSFGEFYNPKQMGFRMLRVINEDRVEPSNGFDAHPHADMEIITYVLEGTLKHRDSMGNGSLIRSGDVQRMSAGTGVRHSEHNASPAELVHFFQIWILPEKKGATPEYEQKHFPASERTGNLKLVASQDGRAGSITVHQDVSLYAGLFNKGSTTTQAIASGRGAWLHVVRGAVTANGQELLTGDALALSEEAKLDLTFIEDSEILLFDLA